MLVMRVVIQTRIAHREDPKQSDLSLRCLPRPFRERLLVFKMLEHLPVHDLTYLYLYISINSC